MGTREEAVRREFRVGGVNWMGAAPTDGEITGMVKIRSSGPPSGPVVFAGGVVRAPEGIFGVAPGQSAALYSPDGAVLCGGVIAG